MGKGTDGRVSRLVKAFEDREARASLRSSSASTSSRTVSVTSPSTDRTAVERDKSVELVALPSFDDFASSASTLVGTDSASKEAESCKGRPTPPSRRASTTPDIDDIPFDAFERGAKPLSLPDIDSFLESLASVSFTPIDEPGVLGSSEQDSWKLHVAPVPTSSTHGRIATLWARLRRQHLYQSLDYEKATEATERKAKLFPPFHLVPDQLSVTDLKLNRWRPRSLTTLSAVLGSTVDIMLGVEGSTIGISYTSLESIRDLAQSAISSAS